MSYLLKYKLLQSYLLNKNWHPGNFVPADYYRLKIGTLINDEKITIKNRATDTSINNIGNNSKNLYYAISTSAIHNEDPNNFKNSSNIKWKQLVDGSITIGSKDFYDSVEKVYIYLTALYDINNIKKKSENMYRTRYRSKKELEDNSGYEYIYTNSDSNTSYGSSKIYSKSNSAFTNIDIDLQILPSAPDSSRPETSLGTVIMPEGQFESLIFGTNPNHWTTEYIDNFCIYKNQVTTKQEIDKILEENFENLIGDGNTAKISIRDSLSIPVPRFTGSNFGEFKNVFNKRLYYCETYSNCNFYNNKAKLYVKPINIHYRGILNGSNISELTIEFPEFDENLSYSDYINTISFNPKDWQSAYSYDYFEDRFNRKGAFNTSTLKKININFNDANADLSIDRDINTRYWHMCSDFYQYRLSYMFEGINKNATIYINSLLAPEMNETSRTTTCIPLPLISEYNGKIFLKDYYTVSDSKKYTDWYYMLSRKQVPEDHRWYNISDPTAPLYLNYYLYNFWTKRDENGSYYSSCNSVFYVKNDGYDGVNDTKEYFTLPLSGEFYLQLSNSGTKFRKAIVNNSYSEDDYTSDISSWKWENFVTIGTDGKYSNNGMNSYISYNGKEFPINEYTVDAITSAGDTGYSKVIGIGTASNSTQIGNSNLMAKGTGGYVNHIYTDNSRYGISGSNYIEFGKTYYINENDSIRYLDKVI